LAEKKVIIAQLQFEISSQNLVLSDIGLSEVLLVTSMTADKIQDDSWLQFWKLFSQLALSRE